MVHFFTYTYIVNFIIVNFIIKEIYPKNNDKYLDPSYGCGCLVGTLLC